MTLSEMQAKLVEQAEVARTSTDASAVDNALDQVEKLQTEIRRAERVQNLAKPQPKVGAPAPQAQPLPGAFRNSGEFYRAVGNTLGGVTDPRLVQNVGPAFAGEGVPADGGFAVTAEARKSIMELLQSPESLFSRLDLIPTISNTITVPTDENPDWSTAGVTAGDVAEGALITESKPALTQVSLSLTKQAALVYASSEQMEDSENFGGYIQSKSAKKLTWKTNAKIFAAVMASGSLKTVAKTALAPAGSAPDYNNVNAMWTGLLTQYRPGAVWLANPNLEPVFRTYMVGNIPAYLPAGGISGAQFGTLFNRPVIYTELCSAVGTAGDLVLVDLGSLYGAIKSNGFRVDVSKDASFEYDLVGFRTVMRFAAKSKLSAVVTRPDTTTASNIVVLATRA